MLRNHFPLRSQYLHPELFAVVLSRVATVEYCRLANPRIRVRVGCRFATPTLLEEHNAGRTLVLPCPSHRAFGRRPVRAEPIAPQPMARGTLRGRLPRGVFGPGLCAVRPPVRRGAAHPAGSGEAARGDPPAAAADPGAAARALSAEHAPQRSAEPAQCRAWEADGHRNGHGGRRVPAGAGGNRASVSGRGPGCNADRAGGHACLARRAIFGADLRAEPATAGRAARAADGARTFQYRRRADPEGRPRRRPVARVPTTGTRIRSISPASRSFRASPSATSTSSVSKRTTRRQRSRSATA